MNELRRFRTALGLSQAALAKELNWHSTLLNAAECNRRPLPTKFIEPLVNLALKFEEPLDILQLIVDNEEIKGKKK